MIRFSVNLNKIALIRNARDRAGIPRLDEVARTCLDSGVDGITLHPRPDSRHTVADDVRLMRGLLRTSGAELNLEGNPFSEPEGEYPGFMELVRETVPEQCTLVPDTRDQLTSDKGWGAAANLDALREVVQALKSCGCKRVSLFVDPHPSDVKQAAAVGADCVELYTGPWARAWELMRQSQRDSDQQQATNLYRQYVEAASAAVAAGLAVHAGHDLNLHNLPPIARLPGLQEVSIGQAFVERALYMGLQAAVQAYRNLLNQSVAGGMETQDLFG